MGAAAINDAVCRHLDAMLDSGVHLIWQTGKAYYDRCRARAGDKKHVTILPFVQDVSEAYVLADAVVCRAGALTLAELKHFRKPALLIPSPNVADDHQRHNAESMTRLGTALMLLESEIKDKFFVYWNRLLNARWALTRRLHALPVKNAAQECVDVIFELFHERPQTSA
ncbi:MAG: UDP-N-acetylglucosamine--N-acetylmuramyl-(pentapeptide) pyrophosphoryl-undecaprenol N-acetylglucosamine transferase [Bacteroidia bacterium]|nr:UDP-N-acetylglucosamine--N-acetylmuramyl-(pentapeptide) pyrophosphoryl-undecaprenol N-acetylglucosamine transferase [Bacteroidia bacterium]